MQIGETLLGNKSVDNMESHDQSENLVERRGEN